MKLRNTLLGDKGSRKPLFQVQNLPIDEVRIMGSEKNHLKIISDGMDIIMWNGANNEDDLLGAGCIGQLLVV